MDWFLYDNGLRHERVKQAAGSLVDLFILCQLHISYTKHVKLFLKIFSQGNSLSLFG